jgi:hypothetical protein
MGKQTGLADALLRQLDKTNPMTVEDVNTFLTKENGGVLAGGGCVSQLVCEQKRLRRARDVHGVVYLYKKGTTLPKDWEDLGHGKLRVVKKAPKLAVDDSDDYLICIKWKEDETLTLTPAEARALHGKLSRALGIS